MVFGLPLVGWGGVLTLTLLVVAFSVGFLNKRGIRIIPFRYHAPLAYAAMAAAVIHGTVGILSNLGF
jgi:hypothetical protein